MDSSLRRCLSKALLESGKKLTGRLPVTLMLAYNVPRYFQRLPPPHRRRFLVTSTPWRRFRSDEFSRKSLSTGFELVRTRVFLFMGHPNALFLSLLNGEVLDKMTRFSLDRKVSFDLFKFLFPSSSFVSYISLFLSRILKKIKFKLANHD